MHQVSIPCPRCGQTLVVPTSNLGSAFQCPRCGAHHVAGDLIPTATPIAAVPITTAPSNPAIVTPGAAIMPYAPASPEGAQTPLPAATSGALTQALEVGSAGTRQISRFGDWFLSMADRLDSTLYGKRAKAVGALAALTVLVSTLEAWLYPAAPLFTTLSTFLFALLLAVLFVARLGALRDAEGGWSFALVQRRAAAAMTDLGESLSAFGALSWPLRCQALGRGVIFFGLLGLGLRNVVTLFLITVAELFGAEVELAESIHRVLLLFGVATLGMGIFFWLLGWWRRGKGSDGRALYPDVAGREKLMAAAAALPAVIDCADASEVRALAKKAEHPLLRELLDALASWRPARMSYEDEYQASLHRFLRRRMPETRPVRERPVGTRAEGTAGRADIVLSDSVMIEMKRGLSTSTAQRALGQLYMYLRAWKHGPILLVLCEADPAMAKRFLGREIADLRSKAPVTLVIAARAGK